MVTFNDSNRMLRALEDAGLTARAAEIIVGALAPSDEVPDPRSTALIASAPYVKKKDHVVWTHGPDMPIPPGMLTGNAGGGGGAAVNGQTPGAGGAGGAMCCEITFY